MIRRALLIILFVTALPLRAAADLTVKKNIFEDCPVALAQLATLPRPEQETLVPYLSQVLRLETAALGQVTRLPLPRPLPVPPGSTLDTTPDIQISRTLDPGREIEAKRCAITALQNLRGLARDSLPDLILLTRSSLTPEELRFQAEDAIRSIAIETGKGTALDIPTSFLSRILEITGRVGPPYAENVLLELRAASLPYLLGEFRKSDPLHREAVEKLLQQLDSPGTGITRTLLPLLTSADDSLRKRVLRLLPRLNGSRNDAIGAIFAGLHDLSDDIRKVAAEAIGQAADRISGDPESLTPDVKELLVQGVRSPSDYIREPSARILTTAAEMPDFPVASLLKALEAAEPLARQTALVLLSLKHPLPPEVFRRALDLLYDPNVAVRQTAIRALSKENNRTDEILPAFAKLLKSDVLQRSTDARRLILWEVGAAVDQLAPHARASSLVPFFVEALDERETLLGSTLDAGPSTAITEQHGTLPVIPVENALAKIGTGSVPPLLKLLRSQNDQARARAIRVLGRLEKLQPKEIRLLVPMLKDSSPIVFEQAVLALHAHEKEAQTELQRFLKTAIARGKFGAALLLWPEQQLLAAGDLEAQLADLSCGVKTSLLPLLSEPNLAMRLPVLKTVRPCLLAEGAPQAEPFLARIAPLVPEDQNELVDILRSGGPSQILRLRLLERTPSLGLSASAMTSLALELLSVPENTVRVRAAQFLGKLGKDAQEAVPKLHEMLGNRDEEERLQDEALISLYRINPEALPFEDFLLDELKGDGYKSVFPILERLEARITVSILNTGAESLPSERLVPLVRVTGKFGPEAKDALPMLEKITKRPSSELRFEATFAQLRIELNPENAVEPLQREFGGYFFERVLSHGIPAELLPAVRQVAAQPASVVTEIAANEILRRFDKGGPEPVKAPAEAKPAPEPSAPQGAPVEEGKTDKP